MFRNSGTNKSIPYTIFQSESWEEEMKALPPAMKCVARRRLKTSASEKALREKVKDLTIQTEDLSRIGAVVGSRDKSADGKPAAADSIPSGWTSPKKTPAQGRHDPEVLLNETDEWCIITSSSSEMSDDIEGMTVTCFEVADDVSTLTFASGLDSAEASPTGLVNDRHFNRVNVFGMTFKLNKELD